MHLNINVFLLNIFVSNKILKKNNLFLILNIYVNVFFFVLM